MFFHMKFSIKKTYAEAVLLRLRDRGAAGAVFTFRPRLVERDRLLAVVGVLLDLALGVFFGDLLWRFLLGVFFFGDEGRDLRDAEEVL